MLTTKTLVITCCALVSALAAQTQPLTPAERAQQAADLDAIAGRSVTAALPPSANGAPAVNEELTYKFDENGGSRVINFATVSAPPREGQIVSTLTPPLTSFAPGRFGTALRGGSITPVAQQNRVETGWAPGQVTGDFTYAMHLRVSNNHPAPSLTYVIGVPVAFSFRVFTGGGNLLTSNLTSSTLTTQANIYSMAQSAWVHVALVVDSAAQTATYFINGVPETPVTIAAGGVNFNAPSFNVGQQIPTLSASIYDMDDFRLLTRAALPAEVLAWSLVSPPSDAQYGTSCGATLTSTNGPPTIGNTAYGLTVAGGPNGFAAIGLGVARHTMGSISLPLDLGLLFPPLTGCGWETSAEVFFGVPVTGGSGMLPLPIPNNPSLVDLTIYSQALVIPGPTPQSSNAFATSL